MSYFDLLPIDILVELSKYMSSEMYSINDLYRFKEMFRGENNSAFEIFDNLHTKRRVKEITLALLDQFRRGTFIGVDKEYRSVIVNISRKGGDCRYVIPENYYSGVIDSIEEITRAETDMHLTVKANCYDFLIQEKL